MIRYHSESSRMHEVKFVSLNDIYDFIISYKTKRLFIHEPVKALLRKSCYDAQNYMRKGNAIPPVLLAKLIKLRIITIITDDVHQYKQEQLQSSDSDTDNVFFERSQDKMAYRTLYIILTQFYNPQIIPACCQCGLSISAIVEFGDKNYISKAKALNRESDMLRQRFWKYAPCLYYEHHLDEPFRLIYNPKTVSMTKDNPKLYLAECKRLYKKFIKSINIDKIKYMRDTLIRNYDLNEFLNSDLCKLNSEETVKNVSLETSTTDSSGTGWEENKPLVKRVLPELDIDTRKRYTMWSCDKL